MVNKITSVLKKIPSYKTHLFCIIYLLFIILANHFPTTISRQLIVAHQVISSLSIFLVIHFYRRFKIEKTNIFDKILGLSFLFFAIADFIYGSTNTIVLNIQSLFPSIIIREVSYTLAAILLSIGVTGLYALEKKLSFRRISLLTLSTFCISVFCFKLIIVPFSNQPDSSTFFISNAFIYMLFRSYLISFTLAYLPTENSLPRFFLLCALGQMFLADIALTFQVDALNATKTILDIWFEKAWGLSLAIMAVIVFLNRKKEKVFLKSEIVSLKSIRFSLVICVLIILSLLFLWLYSIELINHLDMMNTTRIYSLVFGIWGISNFVSIFISRQILKLKTRHPFENTPFEISWINAYEIDSVVRYQETLHLEIKKREMASIIASLASQVSHDIRSPLAALDMAIKDMNELPEDTRLIVRHSVTRIRDIANNLLAKNRSINEASSRNDKKIETVLLTSLIEGLVSEKRMQYRSKLGILIHFDLDQKSYGLFSKIETRELKRILSNLINNAVEAFESSGEIKITLNSNANNIEIKVKDNGKGIPPEVLLKLGQKGESFGKTEGNGLGLYHAKTTLESWGGALKLESTVGVGTTITMTLKMESAPSWFVKELKFSEGSRVVVIDDDSSIHQIWDGRFQSSIPHDAKIEVVHLSNPSLAKEWFEENKGKKETRYLIDFEFLGSDSNGIKLISDLGIEKESHLVTSRYEEEHVLKKCLENNIPLIPKNLSAFVPIKVSGSADYVEYVYIEDDMLLRMGWERVAKKKKIKLLTLESPRKFEAHIDKIDPETTKIYIDSSLGENEMKGEDFALELHKKGYKHLYIATGYEKERFAHLPWLKHSGKNCPFD